MPKYNKLNDDYFINFILDNEKNKKKNIFLLIKFILIKLKTEKYII